MFKNLLGLLQNVITTMALNQLYMKSEAEHKQVFREILQESLAECYLYVSESLTQGEQFIKKFKVHITKKKIKNKL